MKRTGALILLAAIFPMLAHADEIRSGKLDNGLTYYIHQRNATPGQADFFLAQRAGSANENDSQQGLAHFLEHMCFNGTAHFPGNSLIGYLESIGVKFGANLNAYTSTDETVYNISKVPTARTSALDSCFLILRDWSCDLTLNPTDIDNERGVIVNEYRQRNAASNRMLTRALPRLYPGSPYGHRMPIGKMEVVENFVPDTLRAFYHRWYNPINQAIIVVGDIDPDYAETTIRNTFGNIVAPPGAQAVPDYPVADNPRPIIVAEDDPEQTTRMLQLHFRHDLPSADTTVEERARQRAANDIAVDMLATRFDQYERQTDCPYDYLGIGDVKFMMSRTKNSMIMRGGVKQGREADALALWVTEMKRALDHGFAPEELEAARQNALKSLQGRRRHAKNENNTNAAKRYVRFFLDGDSTQYGTQDRYLDLLEQYIPQITAEEARQALAKDITMDGSNTVVLLYQPTAPDMATEAQLADALTAALAAETTPYVPDTTRLPILAAEPTPGSIVATDSIPAFGVTVYTLSNGVKVYARQSKDKPEEIFVRGYAPGGLAMEYGTMPLADLRMVTEAMATAAGYGDLDAAQLRKATSQLNSKVSASVSNFEQSIETATSPAELADAMRWLYLRATGAKTDSTAFAIFRNQQIAKYSKHNASPTQLMGDSIHSVIYDRHPLAYKPRLADVEAMDADNITAIYRRSFGNYDGWNFIVAGDFDTDSLRDIMCRYVASLPADPSAKAKELPQIGYTFPMYDQTVDFSVEMNTPQSIMYQFFDKPLEFNLQNVLEATIAGNILKNRLLAYLREEKGWTYSIKTHCAVNGAFHPATGSMLMTPIYIKIAPGHEKEAEEFITLTLNNMAQPGGISHEEVAKVREFMLKNRPEQSKDNAYWLHIIKNYLKFGQDMHTPYTEALEKITPADIENFVNSQLLKAYRTNITLTPAQ